MLSLAALNVDRMLRIRHHLIVTKIETLHRLP